MKKLLSWWDVLTDVERAGTDNIATLIETGESIIADERLAWQSTANRLAVAKRAMSMATGDIGELTGGEADNLGGGRAPMGQGTLGGQIQSHHAMESRVGKVFSGIV